jgi:hypothetical protein
MIQRQIRQVHCLTCHLFSCRYTIRVEPEPDYRSTIEALGEVLALLEGPNIKEALLQPFIKMVSIQEEYIHANGGHRLREKTGKKSKATKAEVDSETATCKAAGKNRPAGESDEMAEFWQVRNNKAALLSFLVALAVRIEREWENVELRMSLLHMYREMLLQLQEDDDIDLRELGRLGPKLKNLNFDLSHFLKMALPGNLLYPPASASWSPRSCPRKRYFSAMRFISLTKPLYYFAVERKHTRGLKDHEVG